VWKPTGTGISVTNGETFGLYGLTTGGANYMQLAYDFNQVFSVKDTGHTEIGRVVTNNYNGQIHKVNGAIQVGGSGTADESRFFSISANAYSSSYGGIPRTTSLGGSMLILDSRANDNSEAFSLRTNLVADGATTGPTAVIAALQKGDVTIGPGSGTMVHQVQGGAVTLQLDAENSNADAILQWKQNNTVYWHATNRFANAYRLEFTDSDQSHGAYLAQNASGWTNISDERVKENLTPITSALSKVAALRTVTYNRIGSEHREVGLVAQDVLKVLPEAVDTTDPEKYGLRYDDVLPLALAAIKELKAENEALKARLTAGGL
jgi:hypothetical protein